MNQQKTTNTPEPQKINREDLLRAREEFHRLTWQYLGQYLEGNDVGADPDVAADLKGWWDAHPQGWRDTSDWPDPLGEATAVIFLSLLTGGEIKDLKPSSALQDL